MNDYDNLPKLFNFLIDYPVDEKKYPGWYPDVLTEPMYPGKDYVLGVCDENIEIVAEMIIKIKDPDHRKLIGDYFDLLLRLRRYRVKKIEAAKKNVPMSDSKSFEQLVKDTLL